MSLRSKILILFVTLALAPLLAVGISDYVQSIRMVTKLVEAHLAVAAERAARATSMQYAALAADLRVLAGEVASPEPGIGENPRWSELSSAFDGLQVLSDGGAVLATLVAPPQSVDTCGRAPVRFSTPLPPAAGSTEPRQLVGTMTVGRLVADGALLPPPLGSRSGYTLLIDRASGRVVYDPRCNRETSVARFEGMDGRAIEAAGLQRFADQFRFREGEVERAGSYVNLSEPPWTVVTSTAVNEFTLAEGRARLASLIFVVFLSLATAGGFAILITHIMRQLEEVTVAAGRVGEGDFTPWLPPPGHDEVGKLSLAIGAMVARVKEMMDQLERSRQMAVVGELASHLSHEIRNPLSSIRLNLQSVDREVRSGAVPVDLAVVLQLCLREITRLDRVVNNVLRLGRAKPGPVTRRGMHQLIDETLDVVQPQLAQSGVRTERRYEAARDTVAVDGEQLSGALLNLYLNAADAMPEGGTLRVWTEASQDRSGGPVIRVHVADEGVGVSPELREQIFRPFFTTKPQGSGIGLPLAQQTAEAHGGRLYLEKRSELEPGAEFVLEIPLVMNGTSHSSRQWQRPTLRSSAPPTVETGAGASESARESGSTERSFETGA